MWLLRKLFAMKASLTGVPAGVLDTLLLTHIPANAPSRMALAPTRETQMEFLAPASSRPSPSCYSHGALEETSS